MVGPIAAIATSKELRLSPQSGGTDADEPFTATARPGPAQPAEPAVSRPIHYILASAPSKEKLIPQWKV